MHMLVATIYASANARHYAVHVWDFHMQKHI